MVTKYVHRLNSFKGATRTHKKPKRPLTTVEHALTKGDGSDSTDLSFAFISVPQHLDDETKMDRLSMLSDTILSVENSDVLVLALWVAHPD